MVVCDTGPKEHKEVAFALEILLRGPAGLAGVYLAAWLGALAGEVEHKAGSYASCGVVHFGPRPQCAYCCGSLPIPPALELL